MYKLHFGNLFHLHFHHFLRVLKIPISLFYSLFDKDSENFLV
ncbi:058L [Invertebrate iridescent virus 6]|uniref:058L n=1 Tax=Invertebrate iridescent virus 6 TaxID=176652 RepID=Q91G43_IIV6|nr:058L [Invertebrate iridescent virus 6]AAK81989.1 058L [Invertebrate iridescent virus 6]QMS79628.1 hypothetical protein IIV6-T1_063 [Invertebrate iridescent virus 6]